MRSLPSESEKKAYNDFVSQQACLTLIKGQDVITKIKEKETFWLYFGADTCLHCQEVTPLFCELATKLEINIFYVDINANKPLKIDAYEEIEKYLGKYFDYDKDGNKQLFTPLILHFSEGVVDFNHLYTVKGHKVLESKMSKEQVNHLKNILELALIAFLGEKDVKSIR